MTNKLLEPNNLYDYQRQCVIHQLSNDQSMLWLQMGLGKTPITLTTIVDRMRAGHVKKTLIFGPLRVIQSVWHREAVKWSHTRKLRFSIIAGSAEKRTRALFQDADVYLCNYENMSWLSQQLDHHYLSQKRPLPFQFVVYDEISKLKNSTSQRMKGGKKYVTGIGNIEQEVKVHGWKPMIEHIQYATGLTGTPAPNGYLDLHGQYLAVDGGARLGKFITHFKDNYFASDYNGWKFTPTEQGKKWIEQSIADITIKMDAADYLDMPEVTTKNVMVDLPTKVRKAYAELEKEMFAALDTGTEIEVMSRSAVSNKCLQFCNGSAYYNDGTCVEVLHKAKLDALADILEDAAGQPVLVAYSYKSDATNMMEKFKKYKPVNLTETPSHQTGRVIDDWQAGKIKLLIGHPASMGHGIDGLQQNGSIAVWFGVNWSLELYEQFNGRLDRNGQKNPVSIIRILCNDTVDLAVVDAIDNKFEDQDGLKKAINRYRGVEEEPELSFL